MSSAGGGFRVPLLELQLNLGVFSVTQLFGGAERFSPNANVLGVIKIQQFKDCELVIFQLLWVCSQNERNAKLQNETAELEEEYIKEKKISIMAEGERRRKKERNRPLQNSLSQA